MVARPPLHLFPGGYAGLEPVEGGRANLCLVIRQRVFADLGDGWPALVDQLKLSCPHLAPYLTDGAQETSHPLAVGAIPYGYVAGPALGAWRLGDQAAVIPSFAGEGMAIALHSAELAAGFAIAGRSPESYQQALASHVAAQIRGATRLSQMLVLPQVQPAVGLCLSLAPGLAGLVARGTRISKQAQHNLQAINQPQG